MCKYVGEHILFVRILGFHLLIKLHCVEVHVHLSIIIFTSFCHHCVCVAVNMFFQFRYAGGLYQYWVILLSYPLGKLTEKFPRGRLLNPGPFLAKACCES